MHSEGCVSSPASLAALSGCHTLCAPSSPRPAHRFKNWALCNRLEQTFGVCQWSDKELLQIRAGGLHGEPLPWQDRLGCCEQLAKDLLVLF